MLAEKMMDRKRAGHVYQMMKISKLGGHLQKAMFPREDPDASCAGLADTGSYEG